MSFTVDSFRRDGAVIQTKLENQVRTLNEQT